MKIPVCHHFWRNGQRAVWEPKKFPVPEIEKNIIDDYEFLCKEKPIYKIYGIWTVFFVYHPGKDMFGRDITAISFAFVKNCPAPNRMAQAIIPALTATGYQTYFIKIKNIIIRDNISAFLKKNTYKITAFIILLIIAAGILSYSAKEQMQTPLQHTAQIDAPTPNANSIEVPDSEDLQKPPVCKFDLVNLYPCQKTYIEHYCDNWPQSTINFRQWFEESEYCIQARRNIFTTDMPIFRAVNHDKKIEQFLRKFLFSYN